MIKKNKQKSEGLFWMYVFIFVIISTIIIILAVAEIDNVIVRNNIRKGFEASGISGEKMFTEKVYIIKYLKSYGVTEDVNKVAEDLQGILPFIRLKIEAEK